jgi:hypothetical protein
VKGGNFQVGGGEGFTIIPEPASLSFLLFGSLAIFHRRKRK